MIEEADGTGVVLRSSWPWRLVTALAPVLVFVLAEAVLLHGDRPAWNLADAVLAGVVWAGFVSLSLWMQRLNRVELRTGYLVSRSGRRTVDIPATAIQAVTLERFLGSRYVTVWTADGQHRRLPTAGRTQGLVAQHFDRDLRAVGDWWLANRSHPGPRNGSPQRDYPPARSPTGSSQQVEVHRWAAWLSVAVIWLVASPVIAWTLAVVPSQRGNSSVEPVIGKLAIPAAGIATALGTLLALITAVRLRRHIPPRRQPPPQQGRRLTRRQSATATAVALGTAALAWFAAWAEIEPGVDAIATATTGLLRPHRHRRGTDRTSRAGRLRRRGHVRGVAARRVP